MCCLDGEEVGGYTTSELEKELSSMRVEGEVTQHMKFNLSDEPKIFFYCFAF